MSLPTINDISNITPQTYRSPHRLDNNYTTQTRFNWSSVLQNNPIDEVQELDKGEIDSDSDSDSDSEWETSKQYYKTLINLKNKTLMKQEKNNDALRTLFKNVIDHQDRCQTIETDVKYFQQNEITLHENYIAELENNVEKLKKKLESEQLACEINKVTVNKLDIENNSLNKQIQCVVCRGKERSILFLPCKHCICCQDCSNNLYNNKCPTCRTEITEKQCIFLN
jgi:hypothetical protein